MMRSFLSILVVSMTLAGAKTSQAFSLLGPIGAEAYQVQGMGYNLPGDIGGPMNLGEEYRWNIPVITYAIDQSFLDYFGAQGAAAVDAAFAEFNKLTNTPFSSMTTNLTEFPLQVARVNHRARALGLLDIKSAMAHLITEQLGLAQAERYVFALRGSNIVTTGGSTNTNFFVIQRNFDPVTHEPSKYVNGSLYTYQIRTFQNPAFHDAVEETLDPNAFASSTVSSGNANRSGAYITGLSRDDVGGLRYLYHTNNVNVENLLPDTELATTNVSALTLLTTTDLATFLQRTRQTTNTVADVLNFYPDALITSTNEYLTNRLVTNYVTYFTNFPVQFPPQSVLVENVTVILETNRVFEFGNVMTNTFYTNSVVTNLQTTVTLDPAFVPGIGSLVTNTNSTPLMTNFVDGEIYFVPTNLLNYQIVSTQLVEQVLRTNPGPAVLGNLFAFTNTQVQVALTNLDLGLLTELSRGTTNTGADIQLLYPGIHITRTNSWLTNILQTNYVGGLVILSNSLATVFEYSYGNVITNTNDFSTNSQVINQIIEVANNPFIGPGGFPFVTNILSQTNFVTNRISGTFYIVPTNFLGFKKVATLFTNVVGTTNIIFTNTTARFTNTANPQIIQSVDLAAFSDVARTNTPAGLQTAFPGLFVTRTNIGFDLVVTQQVVAFLTNYPYTPAGTPGTLVVTTNFFTNVFTNFSYVFGNVLTNTITQTNDLFTYNFFTNTLLDEIYRETVFNPYLPAGSTNLLTNVTIRSFVSNEIAGSIIIVPTNLFGYHVVSNRLTNVVPFTNFVYGVSGTNFGVPFTNTLEVVRYSTNYFLEVYPIEFLNPTNVGLTNTGVRQEFVTFSTNIIQSANPIELLVAPTNTFPIVVQTNEVIVPATNTTFAVNPIVFVGQAGTNVAPTLRRGVDMIRFQKTSFDSLLGASIEPVTNVFSSSQTITNGSNNVQFIRRISSFPDFLITAQDLGFLPGQAGPDLIGRTRPAPDNNDAINGNTALAGPGVLQAGIVITFNKLGPARLNTTDPAFMSETTNIPPFTIWGSFDGSTNEPVVFPSGVSIRDLEAALGN